MPRYFFHLFDGHAIRDDEGTVLRDEASARRSALVSLVQAVGDQSTAFWAGEAWTMQVDDDAGKQICLLTLRATT
jgi:hypothetical protein